jgi:cystathionine beta-lyase
LTLFDETIPRAGTDSLKYDLREKLFGHAEVTPLWVADMDFATPACILHALRQRLQHPVLGYSLRTVEMRQALVDWLAHQQGWQINSDWIVFSPGVVPSLALAVQAFSRPGDAVIVQPPVYPPFFSCVERNDRRLLRNPLQLRDNRFHMDMEGLEGLLKQGASLLLLCSPHNPGGRVWSLDELQALVALCERYDCLIVSDEIHADLCYSGERHCPTARLSDRVVTLTSPGKTFNIAGITPSATLIANADIRTRFERQLQANHLTDGNLLGNVAFGAAYRQGAAWRTALMDYLAGNQAAALGFVHRQWPSIHAMPAQAGFLLWLDCRALGLRGDALSRFFIDRGLGLSPGFSFGVEGDGFMRLNFALPRDQLMAALGRIAGDLAP